MDTNLAAAGVRGLHDVFAGWIVGSAGDKAPRGQRAYSTHFWTQISAAAGYDRERGRVPGADARERLAAPYELLLAGRLLTSTGRDLPDRT
ncbi:hypothetical protein B7495_00980 [Cryobacterium sp. LW097]|nr:hypothetical protein B7495_00980 [Cryobacterium sp. LW097]